MPADRRYDLWFAVLLVVFAAGVVGESWRMPRLEHLGVHPMSAPGLTPGLLGLVLLGLALALMVRSMRQRRLIEAAASDRDPGAAGRTLLTLGLTLAYAIGLVGRVPFWLATGLFVFTFVGVFGWDKERQARSLITAVIMAVVTAVAVTLLFERVFLVRLP